MSSKMPAKGISVRSIERNVKWLEKHPAYGVNGTKKISHEQRLKIAYRFAKAMYHNKKESLSLHAGRSSGEATKETHIKKAEKEPNNPVSPSGDNGTLPPDRVNKRKHHCPFC